MNKYAYANSNPINIVDPRGLFGELPENVGAGCPQQQERQSCEDCCLPLLGFPVLQYYACVALCKTGVRSMCLDNKQAFRLGDGKAHYEPEKWNNPRVGATNNCYNYATNQQNCTVGIPGLASGIDPTTGNYSCEAFDKGLVADGLVPTTSEQLCAENCYPVALFLDPGEDFHFYRRDDSGFWSSKSGGQDATNYDWSGNIITDNNIAAGTVDSGPYTQLCGYYCVCQGQVKEIQGRLPGPCAE